MSVRIGLGTRICAGTAPLSVLIAEAAGKWLPAGLVNDGAGKVQQWTNSGTGGTNYDLLTVSAGTRPTLSATGDRAGTGPACLLVRASATKLATAAFSLNQPMTQIWVAKALDNGNNQRLTSDHAGGNRNIYQWNGYFRNNCGAEIALQCLSTDWTIRVAVMNGASSVIQFDSTSTTGNAGTNAATGLVLGDYGTGGGAAWDGPVERGYLWTRALTGAEIAVLVAGI